MRRTFVSCLLVAAVAQATTLNVSPDGPLTSLQAARDAIRSLKAKGPLTESVRVIVAAGHYTLSRPFDLGAQDSGTEKCPITYEAAEGATPVFSAGRRITGWKEEKDGIWAVHLPEAASGKWTFEQLWVNGRRAIRAREPDLFYYYGTGKVTTAVNPLTGKKADMSRQAFRAGKKDIAPLLALSKQELDDVAMTAYHSWSVSVHRIGHIDPQTGVITATGPSSWPFFKWKGVQRYHLENYEAALDRINEWFLRPDGTLIYKPPLGEDVLKAEIVAPVVPAFMRLTKVEHVTLRGFAFRHSQYVLPKRGQSDYQAAISSPAGVTADYIRNVTFDRCEFGHVGGYGIHLHRGCRNVRIQQCHVHDLLAGGIRIGTTKFNTPPPEADLTSHVTVDNCIVRGGGRRFCGAVGILVGHASDNTVTHNDVSDFNYSASSVGWMWKYGFSPAKRNKVEYNHFHHLGWGVMSDMGAVYTLGESEGTTVSHNVIHDIYAYTYGGWGLYTDQASTGIVFENNLVYNVKSGTFHQHWGHANTIRNNILAFSLDPQIRRSRVIKPPKVEKAHSFTFENNIVIYKTGECVSGRGKPDDVVFRSNLYWNTSGAAPTFFGKSLAEWQAAGHGKGSIIADPGFVDVDARDFRLKPGSPALKVGFEPFDFSKAGVYGDPAWMKKAKDHVYPPLLVAPTALAPPMAFSVDYESTPVGKRPSGPLYVLGGSSSVAVAQDTAAKGKRSLKVVDGADVPGAHNPHFYFQPAHRSGVTRCSFDIRVGEGVKFWHEWRNDYQKYKVGPSLWIDNGRLRVEKKATLIEIPTDEWVHIEISAGLGAKATGTWDLAVTLPGQEPKAFNGLRCRSPEWNMLNWLGFCSMEKKKTVYHIDNLTLTNDEVE